MFYKKLPQSKPNEIPHALRAILVMNKMSQASPAPLVKNSRRNKIKEWDRMEWNGDAGLCDNRRRSGRNGGSDCCKAFRRAVGSSY